MSHVTLQATPHVNSTTRHVAIDAAAAAVAAAAFETELGWIALAYENTTVLGIVFGHPARRQSIDALRRYLKPEAPSMDVLELEDQPPAIVDLVERLTAYAAGEPVEFGDVRVDERHLTRFGRRIQQACRRIPRGETLSYGELAAAAGSSGAARAVGQAMARNRFPLVVPCHRVLASGGRIGGFSSPQGLAMKRRLLALEGSEH
jgi:methylated-DNA-[protein]-cysteine S-methyltransferase